MNLQKLPFCIMVACTFLFSSISSAPTVVKYEGIRITHPKPSPLNDTHLLLGNPSGAKAVEDSLANFLIEKPQYSLSYNSKTGVPNWVSWHLSSEWQSDITRNEAWQTEGLLPKNWYKVKYKDYTNSQFDRGHVCPSADRSNNEQDMGATYSMSNIIPQAPACNQQTWRLFEEYCQGQVHDGKELYIMAGGYGIGGAGGKYGKADNTTGIITPRGNQVYKESLAGGKISVPKMCWKVALILDEKPGNDLARINDSTRVIAIAIPNQNAIFPDWKWYITTVDIIEKNTGLDLLSAISDEIEVTLQKKRDKGE